MKKKILVVSLSLITILVFFVCIVFNKNNSKSSNVWSISMTEELVSMSNRCRNGITVKDSEWIYFSNIKSDSLLNSQGSLFKMDFEGKKIEKILDVAARNLIIKDNYLYYLDSSNNSSLHKISLKDYSNSLISNKTISEFIIVDNWIYFSEEGEVEYSNQISKMRLDGSDYLSLMDSISANKNWNCSDLIYNNEYIYFTSIDNQLSIYRMAIKSGEVELMLKDEGSICAIVDNDILVFNQEEFRVFDLSTGEFDRLIKNNLGDYRLDLVNFYDDSIYAIGYKEGDVSNRQLLKIDRKGYEVIYSDAIVNNFNIQDKWLFFLTYKESEDINKIFLHRMNLYNIKTC